MNLLDAFKAARRVSVPLLAVRTPDPASTIRALTGCLDGDAVVSWDVARGVQPCNEPGKAAAVECGGDGTIGNPAAFLEGAAELPAGTVAYVHNAQEWLSEPIFVQAVWNLRDTYKADRRTLVLLGPSIILPAALRHDVIVLDEALPEAEQLAGIVKEQDEAASVCNECAGDCCPKCTGTGLDAARPLLDGVAVDRAVEAVQGLSAFAAEQVVAMSLRKHGLDQYNLWEAKRQQIEQTKGLTVWRGTETFGDIGGLDFIKEFLRRIIDGNRRPRAVVIVDEIEKMIAGSEGAIADSSGVSQGVLQALLTHMQDHDSRGLIFLGPPGCGKTFLAKCLGNEAEAPAIYWDSGAMKDSLVGSTEGNVREALKVVTAVSKDRALWVASCNSVRGIPTALRRRFSYGTYYFSLPTKEEREKIWRVYNGSGSDPRPDDDDWTGAEIRTCCELAADLDCELREAAGYIVPVAKSMPGEIQALRKEAEGRYRSASTGEIYGTGKRKANRKMEV